MSMPDPESDEIPHAFMSMRDDPAIMTMPDLACNLACSLHLAVHVIDATNVIVSKLDWKLYPLRVSPNHTVDVCLSRVSFCTIAQHAARLEGLLRLYFASGYAGFMSGGWFLVFRAQVESQGWVGLGWVVVRRRVTGTSQEF